MNPTTQRWARRASASLAAFVVLGPLAAAELILFADPSGLAGEADLTLADGGSTLVVRLRNTSTGVPAGFDSSDQLLTAISFDFGTPGLNPGDPVILGGTVEIAAGSESVHFTSGSFGAGTNVGGEWGFGNSTVSGQIANFVTCTTSGATMFGGPNLDGPFDLDGPQAGLVAEPTLVSLGGLGAIQTEIVATLAVDPPLTDFVFLQNGARIEFGSDAAFVDRATCPNPATATSLGGGCGATMSSTPPIMGTFATLTVEGDVPGAPGALFTSIGTSSFAFLGCEIVLNPVNMWSFHTFATDGSGTYHHTVPVPLDATRCGEEFPIQAIVFSTSGPLPFGSITNGLLVKLGA